VILQAHAARLALPFPLVLDLCVLTCDCAFSGVPRPI
jgi:hypothetical protein